MAPWFRASFRRWAPGFLGAAVLALLALPAQARTPIDPATGLSIDFCQHQAGGVYRENTFNLGGGSNGAGTWKTYQCKSSCTAATLAACSYTFLDATGNPLTYTRPGPGQPSQSMLAVDFEVDSMAGSIVYSPDGDATKTVALHGGVGGTDFSGTLSNRLLNETSAVVAWVSWLNGAPGVFYSGKAGWFTRKDANGVTIKTQSKRPATILRWLHDNLAAGNPIGTAGCSMGTVATLSPGVWWQSKTYFKYQQLVGGPANWNVNASCGKGTPVAQGACDANPRTPCDDTHPCPGTNNQCNRLGDPMAHEFYDLMNYLAAFAGGTSPACQGTGTAIVPAFNGSSFDPTLNVGDFALGHPVDFLTDEQTNQPCGPALDDHCMGLGSEEYVFNAIYNGISPLPLQWSDDQGGDHCQSWADGRGLSWLKAAMGL
jgi:hypothetical protein